MRLLLPELAHAPRKAALRALLLVALTGCASAPTRKTVELGPPEMSLPAEPHWDRISLQADGWPTPGDGGTVGVADRLTDGQKAARVFNTAAGTRAPWTFVFRLRGSHPAPAAVVLETPVGAGCRPSDLTLFYNDTRSTLDRSGFTRFIEASSRVGFAELLGEGGRYLLRLPAGIDPGYLWFRVMKTVDGAPPCIAEVTALATVPAASRDLTDVVLRTVDTSPYQGKNYMGFGDAEGSGAPEGSAAPAAPPEPSTSPAEGSGLLLPDASESAFGVKAPPAQPSSKPSTKPR